MRTVLLLTMALLASCAKTGKTAHAPANDLRGFVADVERLVDDGDWKGVLARADAAHKEIQLDQMGMGEPQYLAELLGLHSAGNNLDKADDGLDQTDLKRIADLTIDRVVEYPDGAGTAHGTVTLHDGPALNVTIEVIVDGSGAFWLSGAVG